MHARDSGLFETSDGTQIWYQTVGEGPLTLVLCDGVACAGYIWKYFIPAFADQFKIIHSQYRGHGESAIPEDLESMRVERFSEDILELLEDLAPQGPLIFVGHSMGVQVALECYRQDPARVAGLILVNGPYGEALKHVHNTPVFSKALPRVQRLFQKWDRYIQKVWRPFLDSEVAYLLAMAFEVNPWLTQRQDFRVYFEDLGAMQPQVYLAAIKGATNHTAEDLLPHVKVPALVVAGDKDRFTPYRVCLVLHQQIPASELMTMPTGSHIGPLELPELLHLRVDKFLRDHFLNRNISTQKKSSSQKSVKATPMEKVKKSRATKKSTKSR